MALGREEVRLGVVGERGENLVELAVGNVERARDPTEADEMLGSAGAEKDVVDCVDGAAAVAGEPLDPGADVSDRVCREVLEHRDRVDSVVPLNWGHVARKESADEPDQRICRL